MPRAPRAPKAKAKGATPSHRRTAKDSKKDVLETPEAALKTGDKIPGNTDEGPVYFWKPNDENGYLGQWYDSPWTHEGDTYETAEMWMMVGKARLFKDEVGTLPIALKHGN